MFRLQTDHPVAVNSIDHLYPRATAKDNSVNLRFNERLHALLRKAPLSVLDLGCAGGGMVKSFLDQGHIAVGLEGSDYSLNNKRAEWATIPESLFTCDVTRPFTLTNGKGSPYQFDVVTAWEFLEHIEMPDLPGVMANVDRHLKPGGYLICSVSDRPSVYPGDGLDRHRTKKPYEWWAWFFEAHGFKNRRDLERHFNGQYVRKVVYTFILQKGGGYGASA